MKGDVRLKRHRNLSRPARTANSGGRAPGALGRLMPAPRHFSANSQRTPVGRALPVRWPRADHLERGLREFERLVSSTSSGASPASNEVAVPRRFVGRRALFRPAERPAAAALPTPRREQRIGRRCGLRPPLLRARIRQSRLRCRELRDTPAGTGEVVPQ